VGIRLAPPPAPPPCPLPNTPEAGNADPRKPPARAAEQENSRQMTPDGSGGPTVPAPLRRACRGHSRGAGPVDNTSKVPGRCRMPRQPLASHSRRRNSPRGGRSTHNAACTHARTADPPECRRSAPQARCAADPCSPESPSPSRCAPTVSSRPLAAPNCRTQLPAVERSVTPCSPHHGRTLPPAPSTASRHDSTTADPYRLNGTQNDGSRLIVQPHPGRRQTNRRTAIHTTAGTHSERRYVPLPAGRGYRQTGHTAGRCDWI